MFARNILTFPTMGMCAELMGLIDILPGQGEREIFIIA